jgi:nitroreductase
MDAIEALTTRASNGKLVEPAPDDETLALALAAAARAPDHGMLRPLRVHVIRGDARHKLGELMAGALARKTGGASPEELEKMRGKALRAPMILVVSAVVTASPKIPVLEQVLCAGAAATSILLALHARGFGAIWRTGDVAYDAEAKAAFGLGEKDALVGFIYTGTPKQPPPAVPRLSASDFAAEWPA